jgi:hypothetical protein
MKQMTEAVETITKDIYMLQQASRELNNKLRMLPNMLNNNTRNLEFKKNQLDLK